MNLYSIMADSDIYHYYEFNMSINKAMELSDRLTGDSLISDWEQFPVKKYQ